MQKESAFLGRGEGGTARLSFGDNLTIGIKACWFPSIFSNKTRKSTGISHVPNFNILKYPFSKMKMPF